MNIIVIVALLNTILCIIGVMTGSYFISKTVKDFSNIYLIQTEALLQYLTKEELEIDALQEVVENKNSAIKVIKEAEEREKEKLYKIKK